MSIGILGNKIGMTQIFDAKGNLIPVTIIKSSPCYITQLKTKETCGYDAIQVGYFQIDTNKLTKPELGHLAKNNLPSFKHLKEFQLDDTSKYNVGQKLDVSLFEIGERIEIVGLTIGKGNAGNIKKNHFTRGPMGHGSKHHRLQGSLGAGTSPGRVFPGKRMPGRLGHEQRTISGLKVININTKENILLVKGSIPGKAGNLITIKKS